MRLRPAGVPAPHEINRATPAASSPAKTAGAPQDAIEVSSELETLTLLQSGHSTKVAQVAAAIHGGAYEIDPVAVSKSIVEDALPL